MEKNQNGYPVREGCGITTSENSKTNRSEIKRYESQEEKKPCTVRESTCLDELPIAYAYVPMQKFRMLYPADAALKIGTLFEELDLPVGVYGHD